MADIITRDEREFEISKKNNLINQAKGYEGTAKRENSAERIGKAYEEAGDTMKKAGEFSKAEDYYVKAERLGYTYNPEALKRMEEKIKDVRMRESFLRFSKQSLRSRVMAFISMITLSISLFFVTAEITGFTIFNAEGSGLRYVGLCFFACGLIFAFLYLKCKNIQNKKYAKKKKKR